MFDGNRARQGGALFISNSAPLEIVGSTFSNNGAVAFGAAQIESGSLSIVNSTFAGNEATQGVGGALYLANLDGASSIRNATFANNRSMAGGGYFAAAVFGQLNFPIVNTVFSNNLTQDGGSPMQCSFSPAPGACDIQWPRNHVAGGAPDFPCVDGIVFADPVLGALADNGGPTPTLMPAGGSPLRGAGRDCPGTDQRGQARNPAQCTIGAVGRGADRRSRGPRAARSTKARGRPVRAVGVPTPTAPAAHAVGPASVACGRPGRIGTRRQRPAPLRRTDRRLAARRCRGDHRVGAVPSHADAGRLHDGRRDDELRRARSGHRQTRLSLYAARSGQRPAVARAPGIVSRLACGARAAGFGDFEPDACLVNRYVPGARLSRHRDADERDFGQPIVSVSLGLPATFLFGGAKRSDPTLRVPLEHGDVVVWGGDARCATTACSR